jgi:cell division protein FtsW (lipid II flippase)
MRFGRRGHGRGSGGPEGIAVRVKKHNRPDEERREARLWMPKRLSLAVVLAGGFYLLAHLSVVRGVWPVHGVAPGSGGIFLRDMISLVAWLLLLLVIRRIGYRGNWAVVALPIIIFLLTRPSIFQLFSDPVYQASSATRAEANALKAERAQLTTILRAYDEERRAVVFDGEIPDVPEPLEALREATRPERSSAARALSAFSVVLAPLALLAAFLWARRSGALRRARERRAIPFGVTLAIFFALTLFFTELGKVNGTTPWELLLPIFVLVWAAVLADDSYNLARPDAVVSRRRVLGLILYGALPVVPFLVIRELGLSIVLAGSLATMLLVGTRRGWWAGLMLAVWAVLVFAAFSLDERSQTRLALAIEPYRDLSEMTEPQAEAWAAKVHQIKLFDSNVLAGGLFGRGPGRGHAETAPNAADDGYITTIAAQWGWLGALALVLLYTAFLIQMLAVAVRERSAFERSLVTGLAMLLAIPFWLATLGGIRVIPLTGVAVAFAAHGGAKLLASALAVGVVAGISHRRAESDRLASMERPLGDLSEQGVRIR